MDTLLYYIHDQIKKRHYHTFWKPDTENLKAHFI